MIHTACPKTDVLATREEILKHCETFYGVPIAETGEDGEEGLMAIGHYEPRRILAALLAYCRSRGMGLEDLELPNDFAAKATQLIDRATNWALIYRHTDAETAEEDWHEPGWCICEEYLWWSTQAAKASPNAIPVMWWNYR